MIHPSPETQWKVNGWDAYMAGRPVGDVAKIDKKWQDLWLEGYQDAKKEFPK